METVMVKPLFGFFGTDVSENKILTSTMRMQVGLRATICN